jgi:hypothetical protein
LYFLDRFDVLMSKMIFKKWKNIIGMYFSMKSYLKNNRYHTAKHTDDIAVCLSLYIINFFTEFSRFWAPQKFRLQPYRHYGSRWGREMGNRVMILYYVHNSSWNKDRVHVIRESKWLWAASVYYLDINTRRYIVEIKRIYFFCIFLFYFKIVTKRNIFSFNFKVCFFQPEYIYWLLF